MPVEPCWQETDTSFGGGYIGRRVKIEDVEASNAVGDDLSTQVRGVVVVIGLSTSAGGI